METAELELVPRVEDSPRPTAAPTAAPSTALAVVTVKEAALAKFSQTEKDLLTLAKRYENVAFDVSTPKGLKEAKEARAELRKGRYAVQNIETETKDELNDLKKTLKAHAEKLIAIVKPTEDGVDQQIEAREKAIADEKAKEAERVAAHRAEIAKIAGYVAQAQGKPAERIAVGIEFVEAIDVSAERFEEFAGQAAAEREATLLSLRQLHTAAAEAERIRAEHEAQQRTIAALAAISAHVSECVGQGSEFIAARLASMPSLLPEQAGELVTAAYLNAYTQLEGMFEAAQETEKMRAELAAARAAAQPAAPAPAPQVPAEPESAASGPESDLPVDSGGTGDTVFQDAGFGVLIDRPQVDALPHYTPPAFVERRAEPTVLRHQAKPLPCDQRLLDAAALAKKHGGTEMGGCWMFDHISDLADLIDAARA
jgi:hypothetical protein